MKLILGAMIVFILIGGCKQQIEFVGEEYTPTDHVDLYCSWQDVQESNRVMGHLVVLDEDIQNVPKMRKNMLKVAQQKGADAIVIVGAGPCADGATSEDLSGSSALRAHQVKISLLKYRVAEQPPTDTTEATAASDQG